MLLQLAALAAILPSATAFKLRQDAPVKDYAHPAWLQSCENIYLDVGTNIGVQIRKLFEPEKYPDAKILDGFERIFGPAQQRPGKVCALGMEPNPHQQARLQALQAAYSTRGFRVHVYPYAAWKEETTMHFELLNATGHEEWNAHIAGPASLMQRRVGRHVVDVRAVDLAAFIRSLPTGSVRLMKLDIEGAEYETLAHAIPLGIMCQDVVEEAYMETHPWGGVQNWKDSRGFEAVQRHILAQPCPGSNQTAMLQVDDETYLHDVDNNFTAGWSFWDS